jgi:hypothetical protein
MEQSRKNTILPVQGLMFSNPNELLLEGERELLLLPLGLIFPPFAGL